MVSKEVLMFVIVGIFCAFIDIGIMQLSIWFGLFYIAATTLGFAVGFIANFLLHNHVTFRKVYSHGALVRFASVVLINCFVTVVIVYLFQMALSMPLLGKLVSLPIVALNGFLLSKNWVYRC